MERKHWLDMFGALRRLQHFDATHDTSLVREIEMTVDRFAINPGYAVQFFEDFRVFGLAEAIEYAENSIGPGFRLDQDKDRFDKTMKELRSKVLDEVHKYER